MQIEAIQKLIESHIENCIALIEGDGYHFNATVIADIFDNLPKVKQQQLVYQALTQPIKEGSLHAITIKTFTPTQWKKRNNG